MLNTLLLYMEQLHTYPSLSLILSPMCAGKSTELIRRLSIYSAMGLPVVYINSVLDTRDSVFSTHNKTMTTLGTISSLQTNILADCDVSNYKVIGIDESQFYSDLKTFVIENVEVHGKILIVAGLNGDFRRNVFGQMVELIPFCDSITKLSSFCVLCSTKGLMNAAPFTKRIDTSNENQIVIGGYDSYIPVCRNCYV